MKTTVDKAGKVAIPAPIRRKLGLVPGTKLEVVVEDSSLHLLRRVPGPKIIRVGKFRYARPTAPTKDRPAIDVRKLIEEERNRWPW